MLTDKQFDAHNEIVLKAVEAEREACAKIASDEGARLTNGLPAKLMATNIAAMIRART